MLLEEDRVMEKSEEIRQPSCAVRDEPLLPARRHDEDDRHASDELPPWPISPPPMPWPRVFPSL
jgi:hypothetical protein